MGKNKRKSQRIRLGVDAECEVEGSNKSKKLICGKISISGIMIYISEKLAKGTTLELKVKLPTTGKTISVKARIVYILENHNEEYPPFKCGLEFIDLNDKDREQLSSILNEAFANLNWEYYV